MSNANFTFFNEDDFYENGSVKNLGKAVLPDPELLDYYNNLSQRIIFVNGDIDDQLVFYSKQIIDWNKEDKGIPIEERKKIKIFIHTDGGEITAMWNFINIVQLSKTPCMTIAMGKIFSAGAMMFLAAPERLIFKNTEIMIHKGSSGVISDIGVIINYSKFLEKETEMRKEFIFNNTKITPKKYKEIEDKDWYIMSPEAIEWGVATRIVENIEELF
jgi:ATP-dependent Clp protease protease subunit